MTLPESSSYELQALKFTRTSFFGEPLSPKLTRWLRCEPAPTSSCRNHVLCPVWPSSARISSRRSTPESIAHLPASIASCRA